MSISLSRIAGICVALATALNAQTFNFAAATAYSDAHNGHAVLAMHRGAIVHEAYSNGWSSTQAHRLASGTKSFAGVMLAIAVDDGLVGFDEPLANIITEWQGLPTKGRLTYRQLVGLHSGLAGGQSGVVPSYAESINARVIAAPNTQFSYGPYPSQIFGEALRRKLASRALAETVSRYLLRKLLLPLGMQVTSWRGFSNGEPNFPSGVHLFATEWVKFAEMVRLKGFYNGRRIVSETSLAACFRRGPVNNQYGLGWWLQAPGSVAPTDLVMAKGAGKQRIYELPSQELVVIRFGETAGAWSEIDFLAALMPSRYLRYGHGCGGLAGTPNLWGGLLSPPAYGQTARFHIDRLRNNAHGQLFLGFSRDFHLGLPLPLGLGLIGMPGCVVFASLDVGRHFAASGGLATLSLPIPRDNVLPSNSVYLQAVVFDATANPTGLSLSNALEMRIGLR